MKFILFSGDNYYPDGGANDIFGVYETHSDAKLAFNGKENWAHVYSVEMECIVSEFLNGKWIE